MLEDVEYKQWVITDKTTLLIVKEKMSDFIDSLADKIVLLTRHHYTAKAQSSYLKLLKETLLEQECILLGDFSENYSFIVQDAAQGFHWENSQATLSPFVAYHRMHEDKYSISACVLLLKLKTLHSSSSCFSKACA